MILVLTYHELAMVAGTTTTALFLGIGVFAVCVLPWFRTKSQANKENEEGEGIEMTVDPRSHIEENSISSSTGFRGILLRASDWVRAAMIPKSSAVTPDVYGANTENRGNVAKIEIVGKLFREENSTIERPILMARRFNQLRSDIQISKETIEPDLSENYELMEMLDKETRTMETPGPEKYSGDSLTVARREPAAHSTWKNIGPLLGSSIYRQRYQPNYENPRITEESSLNFCRARGSRIEENPLDLSVQTVSRLDAKSSLNGDIAAEKKSARPGMRNENSSFADENGNDGGSGPKRKVFREMLDFLRLKKVSRRRHEASERSDSIKFCQHLSSSFPRDENKNILRANKRKNISTRSHEIVELKSSKTSCDRGFSRKFKKIFDDRQNDSCDAITRLDVKQKTVQIVAEPIQNTRWDEICLLNNNCDSPIPKTTEFKNISSYLKMGNITSINKDPIEPCTEL